MPDLLDTFKINLEMVPIRLALIHHPPCTSYPLTGTSHTPPPVKAGLGTEVPETLLHLVERMPDAAVEVTTTTGKLIGVAALTEMLLLLAPDAVEVVAAAAPE